jgi:DNA modification methylase
MIQYLVGDAREQLRKLPADSVHCIVTSPPYWACRSYGSAATKWADGQEVPLGLEPNPKDYIAHLTEIIEECKRVLHPTGLLFLNLGDTWCGKRSSYHETNIGRDYYEDMGFKKYSDVDYPAEWGLKPRHLAGIPYRTAFTLQEQGWWLRSAFPWIKRNVPPIQSELKRPPNGLEYVFMLAKSMPHYWDKDGILVEGSKTWPAGRLYRDSDWYMQSLRGMVIDDSEDSDSGFMCPLGIVLPTVHGGSEHLARYPKGIVEPCVKLATSERGACPTCLTPLKRVVEKFREPYPHRKTVGWIPLCECAPLPPIPCTVLDPFSGTGTTQEVALSLGRRAIYIDQSQKYADEARARMGGAENPVEEFVPFDIPLHPLDLTSTFFSSREKKQ